MNMQFEVLRQRMEALHTLKVGAAGDYGSIEERAEVAMATEVVTWFSSMTPEKFTFEVLLVYYESISHLTGMYHVEASGEGDRNWLTERKAQEYVLTQVQEILRSHILLITG